MNCEDDNRAREIALRAKAASRKTAEADSKTKNAVLQRLAALLEEYSNEITECNREDMLSASDRGMPDQLVKRLSFDEEKIKSRVVSLLKIASLPDPVGELFDAQVTENGMTACRMRTPLGVILLIYEARPHVTVNSGAFALKSGNAIICKGGSEAKHTNAFLDNLWKKALSKEGMPEEAVQAAALSHSEVDSLLGMPDLIDLVIPRGGKELIESVAAKSKIPVIKHFEGICHVYIDGDAHPGKALKIALDSKLLMPAVCNASETLLIDEKFGRHIPGMLNTLIKNGIQLRGCEKTCAMAEKIIPASPSDWRTEYLDAIYAVRIVDGIQEAITHINENGSGHTDAIVTENYSSYRKFVREVDSGVVLVNASTMFCDGATLGMGAEIGISTDKIHARGPMGLKELTSYKHVILADGRVMGEGYPEAPEA